MNYTHGQDVGGYFILFGAIFLMASFVWCLTLLDWNTPLPFCLLGIAFILIGLLVFVGNTPEDTEEKPNK